MSARSVKIGSVKVGGGAKVSVQSMTKTDTKDVKATLDQIKCLENIGCEIIRVAVPDEDAAIALGKIVKGSRLPIVADIHFHHKLALMSLEAGVAALRINPGNIGASWKVQEVARAAKDKGVPIRVGANSGSLPKELLQKYDGPCAEALVEAALNEVSLLEKAGFDAIKISVKATSVAMTIDAYRKLSKRTDHPLHIGLTEAGPMLTGAIKSAAALIPLLNERIGDTLRVSLTADPKYEVIAAYEILDAAGVRERIFPEVVSCPMCARTSIDVEGLANAVQEKFLSLRKNIKIAVMGCPVNGPGEAKQADFGIAGGGGKGIVFCKGEVVCTCQQDELLEKLMHEICKQEGHGEK